MPKNTDPAVKERALRTVAELSREKLIAYSACGQVVRGLRIEVMCPADIVQCIDRVQQCLIRFAETKTRNFQVVIETHRTPQLPDPTGITLRRPIATPQAKTLL